MLPEPLSKSFSSLLSDIEQGQVKIPQFQRDFVWSLHKSAQLMDSVVKGYPIGAFIIWRTKERLRSVRNIGDFDLPEPREGEYVDYVLDGQQRLTSLFASLKGLTVKIDNREEDYSNIYIDLEASNEDDIVVIDVEELDEGKYIKIRDLLYGGLSLHAAYDQKYHSKLEEYKSIITSYSYSVIQLKNTSIDIATEVFTRLNVGGKPLTLFEIMVAKTYDAKREFDLAESFDDFIERLRPLNYETLSDASVLQTISVIIMQECKRKQILNLKKDAFIDVWDDAIDAMERAVEYFRGLYRIPVSKLLPYNALIVPFAYFFYHHKDKPTDDKAKYLRDFFWRVSLSGRYSSGVEGKLAQDIKRIDSILKGNLPKYDWAIDVSPDFISDNGWFSAGRSFIKAILGLLAYQQPKSFNDDSLVNISNDWLKQANSKNYHHFFPKAYLLKQDEELFYINHIANITIVDDFLNKREIRANPPSKYMAKFKNVNADLSRSMDTHLIHDLDQFGVWDDDYEVFFEQRLRAISEQLEKRIIPQEVDRESQANLPSDYSDDQ